MLDYDGTLAPIAPHPDLATLPPETKNVLARLSNMSDVYIAIISGRNVDNVKKMVNSRTRTPEIKIVFNSHIPETIISF